ncbi:MAG: hypothetical protein JSV61_13650, partial [Anaerolineales bacterium]
QDVAAKMEEVKAQLTKATLYADAERFIQSSDWRAALEHLEKLVELDPTYKEAASKLEQVRKEITLSELYAQAQQLHQSQKWAAVINVCEQIKEIQPNYPNLDNLLTSAQQEMAKVEQQERLKGLYLQAIQAMEASHWPEAKDLFNQVKTIDPDYQDTQRLLERVSAKLLEGKAEIKPIMKEEAKQYDSEQSGVLDLEPNRAISDKSAMEDQIVQKRAGKQIEPTNKSPIVAALLSFFLLGFAGQLYLGQWKKGILLITVHAVGFALLGGLMSLLALIIGVSDAYGVAKKLRLGSPVGEWEFRFDWKAGVITGVIMVIVSIGYVILVGYLVGY